MIDVLNYISIKERMILEDGTSATGGPSIGGMGQVVSAQPSGLAGSTIGTNWSSYGGKPGSGDPSAKTVAIAYQQPAGPIAAPYNPSGSNRVFQDVEMGKNHGAMTGKKKVVLSGGYALNCVANYFYLTELNKNGIELIN